MEVRTLLLAPGARPARARSDAALVAAARKEPEAFLALYDRYFDRVLGYVRMQIRDDATCEDVVSTVFTTALARLVRLRRDASFGGWLFQIARNAVRDVQRRPALAALPDEPSAAQPGLEEDLLARERAAHLQTLVADLPPEQQHLLGLRYGAGLAFDEIGAIVGAAPGTVRVRVHRIVEQLRERYSDDD